jgi:hypothetical protein
MNKKQLLNSYILGLVNEAEDIAKENDEEQADHEDEEE